MASLRRIISDLSSCHDIRLLSGCQAQLELVFREVAATEVLFDNDVNITAAFNLVREALSIVQNEIEQLEGRPQRYQVPTVTDVTLGFLFPAISWRLCWKHSFRFQELLLFSVCLSEQLDVE